MIKYGYTNNEIRLFRKLNTPKKIQDYLNNLNFNFREDGVFSSPRVVIRDGKADCLEGALFAAAALEFYGDKPLLLDLRSSKRPFDYDHVIAVFKRHGCYGALTKTTHAVLRYREPVYKTIRELVMSFFHEYFLNNSGKKTLREYSEPFNLNKINHLNWRTTEDDLWEIHEILDGLTHKQILNKEQIKDLRKADNIEIEAGKLVEEKAN